MAESVSNKYIAEKVRELEEKVKSFKSTGEFISFVKAMAMFHKYSFYNQVLIMSQKPDAIKVAGFHTWKRLGRFVKKGEKGIMIYVPITVKKDDVRKRDTNEDELETDDEALKEKSLFFKIGYVFDVSQTTGKPVPEISLDMEMGGESFYERCLELASKYNVKVEISDTLRVFGLSKGGHVVIKRDDNMASMASTLLHELAHEELHRNRDKTDREIEELEAETVAYVVCSHFGIQVPSDKYLSTWQKNHSIAESLRRISECCHVFIGELDGLQNNKRMATEKEEALLQV